MRLFIAVVIAAVAFGSVEARAGSHWECIGASYVCGSAKKVTTVKGKKKTYAKKNYKKKKYTKKNYKKKSKKYVYAKKNYGGRTLHGKASYYWQPQRVASGGWFNPNAMTAAHKSLPFGTRVRVTNLRNGKSVVVRINDRGPYVKGRIIDLSRAAAGKISMRGAGVVPVRVTVLGKS